MHFFQPISANIKHENPSLTWAQHYLFLYILIINVKIFLDSLKFYKSKLKNFISKGPLKGQKQNKKEEVVKLLKMT